MLNPATNDNINETPPAYSETQVSKNHAVVLPISNTERLPTYNEVTGLLTQPIPQNNQQRATNQRTNDDRQIELIDRLIAPIHLARLGFEDPKFDRSNSKFSSIVCSIFNFLFMYAWSFTMIILGLIYKYDCNIEPFIPKWLMIYGYLRLQFYLYARMFKTYIRGKETYTKIVRFLFILVLIWFIVGNAIVFGNNSRVTYESSALPTYCNNKLFVFSLSSLISMYTYFAFYYLYVVF